MHRALPPGFFMPDEMVELLNFTSKKAFYKKMRELGLLKIDKNGVKHGEHNLPKPFVVEAGWASKLACSYGTGENKEIGKTYYVPIFSRAGLEMLQQVLRDKIPIETFLPKPKAVPAIPAPAATPPSAPEPNKAVVEQERAAALRSLREMGIF